jgi:hypothetical protein
MRRMKTTALACLVLLAAVGCGSDPDATDGNESADRTVETQDGDHALGDVVPPCPFTAEQVSDAVGQPMVDEGDCLFGDGKGVASLTVTTTSEDTGAMTYDYSREQAGASYDEVTELATGAKGYIAVKGVGGEAIVLIPAGAYTLTMSSFSALDPGGYEQVLTELTDAIQGLAP